MILKASQTSIEQAARLLQSGEVVAFSTETVYGLGADATNSKAVEKIFALKNRPGNNPLIVHVASVTQALELIHSESDPTIISRFKKISPLWPGPLSLILPKIDSISDLVSAGGKTIAIRIPNHPIALELLRTCRLPIAAPSANKSFAVSPTTAQHVEESFASENIVILDGGACRIGLESTVLDISTSIPKILRPGAISAKKISALLEETCIGPSMKVEQENIAPLKSPGLFNLHYSPLTPLVFLEDLIGIPPVSNLGIVLFSPQKKSQFSNSAKEISVLSEIGNLEEIAHSLYREIRRLDQIGLDLIAIETCSEEGIGAAIMDRLRRARHLPNFHSK